MLHARRTLIALALIGCGGTPVESADAFAAPDAGRDAAPSVDGGMDATSPDAGGLDAGTDAASVDDVGHDAFAIDAATAHVTAACAISALQATTPPDIGLPTFSGTVGGLAYTMCPTGPNDGVTPKICEIETMWSGAVLASSASTATDIHLTGTLPLRIADIALSACTSTTQYSFDGDGSCPDGAFGHLPVDIDVTVGAAPGMGLTINRATMMANATAALNSGMQLCNSTTCSGLCCASGTHPSPAALIPPILSTIESGLRAEIEAALCQATTCPAASPADTHGICRNTDGSCVPGPAFYGGC